VRQTNTIFFPNYYTLVAFTMVRTKSKVNTEPAVKAEAKLGEGEKQKKVKVLDLTGDVDFVLPPRNIGGEAIVIDDD
jgi:hypothetical protein